MTTADGAARDGPLWAVVPAAGSGTRMRAGTGPLDRPKQYLMLAGRTLIERSLETLLAVPGLLGVVVALAPGDERWGSLALSRDPRVHRTDGAPTRAGSVDAALRRLVELAPRHARVLVHDAARPLASATDVGRLIAAVGERSAIGGLLAVPVQDTLKRGDEASRVRATVPRERLWQAQTPQLFELGALSDALGAALAGEGAAAITDEASAMERAGHAPLLVEALDPNPKITRPSDLGVAEALLRRREESTCA